MKLLKNNINDKEKLSIRCKLLIIYILSLALGTVNIPMGGSILKYIAIFPVLANLFYCFKTKKLIINKIHIMYLIYGFIMILSLFYTKYLTSVVDKLVTNGLFIVLLILASCNDYNKKEEYYIRLSMLWSARITAVLALALGGKIEAGRLALTGNYFVEDPNYLCGYFLFAIIFILNNLMTKKGANVIEKIINIIEIIMYLYVIIITGSRGGIIALGVSIGSYLLFWMIKSKKNIRTIISYAVIVIMLIVSFNIIINNLPTEIRNRFDINNMIKSRGTGRIDLWIEAENIYDNSNILNRLLGHGAGSIRSIEVNGYYMTNAVHNFWLEELIEQGWIGLILMTLINLYCIYITIKKKEYVLAATLIGIIGLTMSLSLRAFKPWWNLIIIISIVCNEKRNLYKSNK
ncbi:O-antigen ligase domain-containing protein [Clostridium perfringens]